MPKQKTNKATRSTKARKKKAARTVTRPVKKRRVTRAWRTRAAAVTAAAVTAAASGNELFFEHPTLGLRIRYLRDDEGDYWFVMRDAAQAMGLASPASAARELPAHTKVMRVVQTEGGPQQLLTISEGGLYRLAGKTRKRGPAQQFTDWLYDVVAPTIRRTGGYTLPERDEPAPVLPPSNSAATPALLEELRSLVAGQLRVDEATERKLLRDLINEVCRQERCTARELALNLGYPPGRGKLFANVPLSEIERLKEVLRQRIIDQRTVTWRIVPRPKQVTQRTSEPSIDYSPADVAARLEANHLAITPDELAGPMGIYDFLGLYPHSDPDQGDITPYLDEPRVLYLDQFIKAHPTTIRLIRAIVEAIPLKVRRQLAELHVEDRREPSVITVDGDEEDDDDDDDQAAAE